MGFRAGAGQRFKVPAKTVRKGNFAFYFVVFSLVHHSLNGLGRGARVGRIGAACLTLGD